MAVLRGSRGAGNWKHNCSQGGGVGGSRCAQMFRWLEEGEASEETALQEKKSAVGR